MTTTKREDVLEEDWLALRRRIIEATDGTTDKWRNVDTAMLMMREYLGVEVSRNNPLAGAAKREDVLVGLEGYTPGPWEVRDYYVYAPRRDADVSASASVGFTVAETYANTRLQARAPRLVDEVIALREALQACVVELEAVQKHDGEAPSTEGLLETIRTMLPDTVEADHAK